jgi:hypothetical protein
MKTHVKDMIRLIPTANRAELDLLAECIQDCLDCAATCTAAATISSADDTRTLRPCMKLTESGAEICQTTAKVLLRIADRDNPIVRKQLQACAIACESCGDECARHADVHEHCRICAEVCLHTAEICNHVLVGQLVV